ncbi:MULTISPECIES: hypothetical protein [unclassified Nostoc]|uniref:hypothetical protein n=1 Tax=unclassified Nostoc TaxID=2593658 RepID=UPI0025AB09CC|nr:MULTISPECIES: hypothetical protein [unclassified Nostoc]MDM9585299.1 hypothetical protein [Nostoc sp. GT001]MDZ7945306.1 hypothetical protein [Nostoc sp. EfeVER01]MDZ7993483.1 hypothetical protein [Nostoc sp. EspVER01]
MKAKERKYNSQIEISDLIDDAVKNAVTRRNEVLNSEEAFLSMSDEEAKNVAGGVLAPFILTTIGIIAPNPTDTNSV